MRRQHACRYLQVSRDEDGMFILRARLEPVAGAAVVRALDAAVEALYQKARAAEEIGPSTGDPGVTTAERARQDGGPEARGAESSGAAESPGAAVSAGAPASAGAPRHAACRDRAADELAPGQRRADALVLVAEAALAGGLDPGTGGDRYQVIVHVDAPVLADPAEQGVSALSDGQHVSAETSRRVACDAATVVMTHAPDGSVLDVGRKTRSISPALRRALTQRDGCCRFPGCGLRLCDAHHVRHWAEGGETSLDNTLLLCRVHHRLVHEEGFQLKLLAGGEPEFRRPDGRLLPDAPLPALTGSFDLAEALAKRLRDGAIVVDPYTSTPTWDGSSVDLSIAVEWFLAATSGRRPRGASGASAAQIGGREWQSGDEAVGENDAQGEDDGPGDDFALECDLALECDVAPEGDLASEGREPSILTYEFTTASGERLPFSEAVWDPAFHLDWNDDEVDDGPSAWVIPSSDN